MFTHAEIVNALRAAGGDPVMAAAQLGEVVASVRGPKDTTRLQRDDLNNFTFRIDFFGGLEAIQPVEPKYLEYRQKSARIGLIYSDPPHDDKFIKIPVKVLRAPDSGPMRRYMTRLMKANGSKWANTGRVWWVAGRISTPSDSHKYKADGFRDRMKNYELLIIHDGPADPSELMQIAVEIQRGVNKPDARYLQIFAGDSLPTIRGAPKWIVRRSRADIFLDLANEAKNYQQRRVQMLKAKLKYLKYNYEHGEGAVPMTEDYERVFDNIKYARDFLLERAKRWERLLRGYEPAYREYESVMTGTGVPNNPAAILHKLKRELSVNEFSLSELDPVDAQGAATKRQLEQNIQQLNQRILQMVKEPLPEIHIEIPQKFDRKIGELEQEIEKYQSLTLNLKKSPEWAVGVANMREALAAGRKQWYEINEERIRGLPMRERERQINLLQQKRDGIRRYMETVPVLDEKKRGTATEEWSMSRNYRELSEILDALKDWQQDEAADFLLELKSVGGTEMTDEEMDRPPTPSEGDVEPARRGIRYVRG